MLETIYHALKVTSIIAISAVFMVAITNLISFISSLVFGNIVGEILSLISMYLPFNANVVFGSLGVTLAGVLTFLIAKKIFDLTSWGISAV